MSSHYSSGGAEISFEIDPLIRDGVDSFTLERLSGSMQKLAELSGGAWNDTGGSAADSDEAAAAADLDSFAGSMLADFPSEDGFGAVLRKEHRRSRTSMLPVIKFKTGARVCFGF